MDDRKRYNPDKNVLEAARERIAYTFDQCEKLYVSFSGGKDSTVMLHLVMAEAIKRGRTVGLLIIDMEAQYRATVDHIQNCVDLYRNHIDLHWVCLPLNLRNAVTNYEPQWTCWDDDKPELWIRPKPADAVIDYDWFVPHMEFEEFMVLWGKWYSAGSKTGAFIGIRADESLKRLSSIVRWSRKPMLDGKRWTTGLGDNLYNIYPIYDWTTQDIWRYHARHPELPSNRVYDLMHKAFTNLLLGSLPKPTREHYIKRFRSFIKGWQTRGYTEIPDEAPAVLEAKQWAPSWRRMAKCLLRNDYWCHSLGQAQPKSEAYQAYKDIKAARKQREAAAAAEQERDTIRSVQDAFIFDDAESA